MVSTFFIGRTLADERRGLTAAVLVGASLSMHLMVLDPKVDTALTAMTTLAIALMLEGRKVPWLRLLAWAVAGLAVLSKGPIGLGVPVLALLPEAFQRVARCVLGLARCAAQAENAQGGASGDQACN